MSAAASLGGAKPAPARPAPAPARPAPAPALTALADARALLEVVRKQEEEALRGARARGRAALAAALAAQGGSAEAAPALGAALFEAAEAAAVAEAERAPDAGSAETPPAIARRTLGLVRALAQQRGLFRDDTLGRALLRGELPLEGVLAAAAAAPGAGPTPRETYRRLFADLLVAADPALAADRPRAAALALATEESCFRAVVAAAIAAEDPPRRQWDSPEFVDLYGGRCGAVAALLDPESTTCRSYGSTTVQALLRGDLTPKALGKGRTRDVCPAATAAEAASVAHRLLQAVELKESNMFACPGCKARRCNYREVQLRAADEAPDYFCRCIPCGLRFKGS